MQMFIGDASNKLGQDKSARFYQSGLYPVAGILLMKVHGKCTWIRPIIIHGSNGLQEM